MYNVSKALRRMEALADWLVQHRELVAKAPATHASANAFCRALGMLVLAPTRDDRHVVWCISVGRIDRPRYQGMPLAAKLGALLWLFTALALEPLVQRQFPPRADEEGRGPVVRSEALGPVLLAKHRDARPVHVPSKPLAHQQVVVPLHPAEELRALPPEVQLVEAGLVPPHT